MIRVRFYPLFLVLAAMLARLSSAQDLTSAQVADLINSVKNVPASRLQAGLPAIRFEDWVQARAGAGAQSVSWTFRRGVAGQGFDLPAFVDFHAMTKDGRAFHLSVGVKANANNTLLFWSGGTVSLPKRNINLEHLSQLPRLLGEPDQKLNPSEAHK